MNKKNKLQQHEQTNILRGYFFMLCLALQFGLQPLFTQTCIDKNAHKPTLVLLCEIIKCIFAIILLFVDGGSSGKAAIQQWSYIDALKCAGVPAAIYAFQNVCIQMAYQNMDPIIFNLLNQTKIVFTAIMVYVLLGKKQTFGQCIALLMLMITGVLLSIPKDDNNNVNNVENDFLYGIVPCLLACMCSGFASAYSQMIMSGQTKRNSYLFSAELSFISAMILFVTNLIMLNTSSPLTTTTSTTSFIFIFTSSIVNLNGMTLYVMIPLLTNACGGIFVGQVTKHAGSVRKIFCVVCGIIMTAVSKYFYFNKPITNDVYVAMPLVFISLYIYNASVNKQKKDLKKKKDD